MQLILSSKSGVMKKWMKNISLKTKKRLKKVVVLLGLILIFFSVLGIFIGYFFEDTVKRIIINELNKRLNTEIIVENIEKDIHFSVFKNFPYASLSFKNVRILDAVGKKEKKDNLLEAQSVSLQFSIIDLISRNYRIKRIEANHGSIKVKIYKDKTDNYHFWKPSVDTASKNNFSLDLEKILLRQMKLAFYDFSTDQQYSGYADKVILKGKFYNDEYTLYIDGSLYVDVIRSKKEVYLSKKHTQLDAELFVNTKQKFVLFKEGGIYIGNMPFEITGLVNYYAKPLILDLRIFTSRLNLNSYINELPPNIKSSFSDYEYTGEMSFEVFIKGESDEKRTPLIKAKIKLSNGSFRNKKSETTLKDIVFEAQYTNGKHHNKETSILILNGISATLNNGKITGNLEIVNFIKPELSMNIVASLDLKDVFSFITTDSIHSAAGRINTSVKITGAVQNLQGITIKDFITSKSSGTLELTNAEIVFQKGSHKFSNLNGHFEFSNNDIISKDFKGTYKSSDFKLVGEFKNILPFIFLKNHQLQINAAFESDFIDLAEILQTNSSKNDTVYKLELPDNIDFSLFIKLKKIVFKKFSATGIEGRILLKDKQFIAKNISLNAMDGSIVFSGLIDGNTKDKLLISCDAGLKKVNIKKLFYELENFNQQTLQDRNIMGDLTADIQFASVWSSDLKVAKPTIYTRANLTIENGALVDYEPLSGLSPYLKNRDLSKVTFNTLKNTIQIKDQVITIPDMEINSNVINFKINGTHRFDKTIDYHISVLISELRRNEKDKNNQVEDIGQIADDGLHKEKYFFRITGTTDKPVYHKLDKEAIKANIKSNINKEKESLKDILNREFGWFKKDTTDKKHSKEKQKEKYDFKVEWDEEK